MDETRQAGEASSVVDELRALLDEQSQRIEELEARTGAHEREASRAPLPGSYNRGTDPAGPSRITSFDGRTKQAFNDSVGVWLWNGRVVRATDDSGVAYGETMFFHGERAIRDALKPTFNGVGEMIQRPWIPVSQQCARNLMDFFAGHESKPMLSEDVFMPEAYEHTEEKGRYLRELDAAAGDPLMSLDDETLRAHISAGTMPNLAPDLTHQAPQVGDVAIQTRAIVETVDADMPIPAPTHDGITVL